jgi:hypothetical protein
MVFLKLLLIILPLALALAWVAYQIGGPALNQGKDFLNKS